MGEPAADNPALAAQPKKADHRFPCKQCGADLLFAPAQSTLQCPFCGHLEKIPATAQEIQEYCFNDYLAKPRATGYGDSHARDVRCESCAAVTHFDDTVRATRCPFCGGPMITEDSKEAVSSAAVIAPEALVPFAITLEQARARFRQWLASRWFAPATLSSESHLKEMLGLYRPYWTYDSHTVSYWTGQRGDHYYETETYTALENGKSVTKTRQVQKTRWTFVSGTYCEFFDDVLIRAGKETDFPTHYQLEGLKPYGPQYLSGFVAERYQLSLEDGWGQAKGVIQGAIHSAVRREIGGDEQRVGSVDTAYSGVTYKHILLPLWLSCYRHGAKTYTFQVNGQTGEVRGSRPYSFWKIFILILSIAAAGGIIALIANLLK